MKSNKFRIAIFGDSASRTCSILCKGLAEYLKTDKRVKVVAVVNSGESGLLHMLAGQSFGWSAFRYLLGKVFGNPVVWENWGDFTDIFGKAKIVEAPNGRINFSQCVEYLQKLSLDGAICIGTPYKFSRALLNVLGYVVNYHDSYLPEYAGRGATKMAYLNGEEKSGFTFHKMVERCDAGNILVQGTIVLNILDIEVVKSKYASAACWPKVIEAMLNNSEGTPQDLSKRTYYSYKDWLDKITISSANPNPLIPFPLRTLNTANVKHRLDIFGYVRLKHKGKYVYITNLNPLRIFYLPVRLWDLVSKFVKVRV